MLNVIANPACPAKDVDGTVRAAKRERHAVNRQFVQARVSTRYGRHLDLRNTGAQLGVQPSYAAAVGREILGDEKRSTFGHSTVPRWGIVAGRSTVSDAGRKE